MRIAGLDDAQWYLRARRRRRARASKASTRARAFVLKARPRTAGHQHAARRRQADASGSVEFAWAPNLEATSVRLQVASDAGLHAARRSTREAPDAARATTLEVCGPGTYHWRIASIKADGDNGPFGDAQRFELRPLPEPPQGRHGRRRQVARAGLERPRPKTRQHVELARDPAFKEHRRAAPSSSAPEWTLPRPTRAGTYYFRYRSVEPDGFVSALQRHAGDRGAARLVAACGCSSPLLFAARSRAT